MEDTMKRALRPLWVYLLAAAPVAQAQTDTAHTDTRLLACRSTPDGMKIGQVATLGRRGKAR
jgi:hypothetical protein